MLQVYCDIEHPVDTMSSQNKHQLCTSRSIHYTVQRLSSGDPVIDEKLVKEYIGKQHGSANNGDTLDKTVGTSKFMISF